MKISKRLTSLFLVMALVAALFVFPASADDTRKVVKTIDLGGGVVAKTYDLTGVYGSSAGKTVPGYSVEFTAGEYIPLAFAYNAGWASQLKTNFEKAQERFGYEVVAAMNGTFFSMSNGYLNSMFVSNGRVACAHSGLTDSMIAFMPDGSIKTVNSCLSYKLVIDGIVVPSGIGHINKWNDEGKWDDKFYYFDVSCGTKSDSSKCDVNGIELICKKTNNTDLIIGGTMTAEVVEVKKDSKGNAFNVDDKSVTDGFALFVKNGSANQKYADIKPGAIIEITVEETVEESREIMENASSVIANIGFLVKDGEDMTAKGGSIGTHDVNMVRGWTALGWNDEGKTIMFVVDDKDRISMRDVAKNLMEMGYTNVARFDGGGSCALYVKDTGDGKPGYLASTTRAISDCLLLVKKTSLEDEAKTAALKEAMDAAAKTLEAEPSNVQLKSAYDLAVKAYGDGHPTYGEAVRALSAINSVGSVTAELDKAISAAERITYTKYTAEQLSKIYEAYNYAKAVRSTPDAATEAVVKAAEDLKAAIKIDKVNVAAGKTYTGDGKWGGYAGNLTDGKVEGGDYDQSIWNGVNATAAAQNSTVVLDLGKVYDINGVSTTVNNWDDSCGISAVSKITVEFSEDGIRYKKVAEITDKERVGFKQKHITVDIPEAVGKARYIRYTYNNDGSTYKTFTMVSEVEAYEGEPGVEKAGFINDFNTKILAGRASIFTPDFVTDFAEGTANIKWTQTAFLEWDEAKQGYKVIAVKGPNGKDEGTLKEGQIAIAVHNSEVAGDTDGSAANREYLAKAAIGSYIEFHGIYIDKQTVGAGAYFKVVSAADFDKNYNGILGDVKYDIPLKSEGDEEITGLTVIDNIITGVSAGVTVDSFKTHFKGAVTVEGTAGDIVCTGCKVTYAGKTYTVVVKGDVNGDGKINAQDYIAVRRHILKAKLLVDEFEAAAHVKTAMGSSVSAGDYIDIRRAILGQIVIK